MFTPLDGMKIFDLYTRSTLYDWLFVVPLKHTALAERLKQKVERRQTARMEPSKVRN